MSGKLTDDGAAYWLAMDGWTADEAVFLLHAIDPRYGRASIVRVGGRACVIQADPMGLSESSEMIARAFEAKALESPAKPADVIAWAKAKGLRLPREFLDARCDSTRQAVPVTADSGKPEWVAAARAIGEDWMLAEEKRTGKRPAVAAIARHVEGELSNRGTVGKHGRYLDWETIKRAALTGITGRGKGENLKNRKGGTHLGKRSPILKGQ